MNYPDDFINKVICGDCLEVIKQIPNNAVDLVLTSPPYNMGNNTLGYQPLSKVGQKHYDNFNDNQDDEQYVNWLNNVIKELLRVSKYVFWNVQFVRSTRKHCIKIQNDFCDNLKDIFIWEKQAVSNITGKQGGMAKGFEFIYMFGRDNLNTFSNNSFPENGYVPNIKTFYKQESFKEHHATYPVELCKYLIGYFSKKENIILDPFLGSGTTAVACKELNRRYIGIEISPEYCAIANERLKQEVLPL